MARRRSERTEIRRVLVEDYEELGRWAARIPTQRSKLTILVGHAGIGKTRAVRAALDGAAGAARWVTGRTSPIRLYHALHDLRRGGLLVLDDAYSLLGDQQGAELVMAATQTEGESLVTWDTARRLVAAGPDGTEVELPKQFGCRARILLIVNDLEVLADRLEAAIDRAHVLECDFPAREIHAYAGGWFVADAPEAHRAAAREVYEFVGLCLDLVRRPSLRDYGKALELAVDPGGIDWRIYLLKVWGLTRERIIAAALRLDNTYRTEEERVARFVELTALSRTTYYDHVQHLGAMIRSGDSEVRRRFAATLVRYLGQERDRVARRAATPPPPDPERAGGLALASLAEAVDAIPPRGPRSEWCLRAATFVESPKRRARRPTPVGVRMPDGRDVLVDWLLSRLSTRPLRSGRFAATGLVLAGDVPHAAPPGGEALRGGAGRPTIRCAAGLAEAWARLWSERPEEFLTLLEQDVRWKMMRAGRHRAAGRPRGLPLVAWLNVAGDIAWERVRPGLFRGEFEHVQFQDLTADFGRLADPRRPPNYHLTLALGDANLAECRRALELGYTVAASFAGEALPRSYLGAPVVDGSAHPWRFLDPPGVVVGFLRRPRGPGEDGDEDGDGGAEGRTTRPGGILSEAPGDRSGQPLARRDPCPPPRARGPPRRHRSRDARRDRQATRLPRCRTTAARGMFKRRPRLRSARRTRPRRRRLPREAGVPCRPRRPAPASVGEPREDARPTPWSTCSARPRSPIRSTGGRNLIIASAT